MKKLLLVLLIMFGLVFAGCSSSATQEDTSEDSILQKTQAQEEISDQEIQVIEVDSFSFGYSIEEIKVKKGVPVKIILTNSGGFHDWVVDEFDARTSKISEGDTTEVIFTPDEIGEFEFYCSVGSHRAQGMVGTLIVEE